MKILLISNMYPCERSVMFGSFIKTIETMIRQNDVEVDRISINGLSFNLVEKIIKYVKFFFRILICNFSRYDIIYLHYPSHSFFVLLFKRIQKNKLVIHIHGHDLLSPKENPSILSRIGINITVLASKRSAFTIVPSHFFKKELLKYNPLANVFVYPSGGVNSEEFFHIPKNNSIFTIGYVGRVDSGKGVDVLINALNLCDFQYRAIIVGGGSVGHGSQLDKMRELVKSYGLEEKVHFEGAIDKSHLADYYNKFDVFIFPTLFQESFGIVGIEAMVCGVPVIGSNIGALPEYIQQEKNGFLFEPGDYRQLAECIKRYYNFNSSVKEQFIKNALETAQNFDSKKLTKELITKFQELCKC